MRERESNIWINLWKPITSSVYYYCFIKLSLSRKKEKKKKRTRADIVTGRMSSQIQSDFLGLTVPVIPVHLWIILSILLLSVWAGSCITPRLPTTTTATATPSPLPSTPNFTPLELLLVLLPLLHHFLGLGRGPTPTTTPPFNLYSTSLFPLSAPPSHHGPTFLLLLRLVLH